MAFEIYNGASTTDPNEVIDKAIEMWSFDSVDQTSTDHTATWGDNMLSCTVSSSKIFIGSASGGAYFQASFGGAYRIVKTSNALLIAFQYNNAWNCIIVGSSTKLDGSTGKRLDGILSGSSIYIVSDGTMYHALSVNYVPTVQGNQLADIMAQDGSITVNGYRFIAYDFSSLTSVCGEYTLGSDNFYIAGGLAIKEAANV